MFITLAKGPCYSSFYDSNHKLFAGKSSKKFKNPYENVPKATIIAIYRKYYLDFVLFGFSVESVLDVFQEKLPIFCENVFL